MTSPYHLIDSHCHLHFSNDREQIRVQIQNALLNNVKQMLCISVDEKDRETVLGLARLEKSVLAAAAIHPTHSEGTIHSVDYLLEYCSDELLIAVGETGLDYFHLKGDLDWQKQRFVNHIQVAKTLNKPLIIHTRDSMSDTLDILEKQDAKQCRGIMHCFTGDYSQAMRALDLGFKISFSGIVSFKSARQMQQLVPLLPEDCLLVETDSPYLTPEPHRGKSNQPAYVKHVAEKIAELRQVSFDEIMLSTQCNFYDLFPHAAL